MVVETSIYGKTLCVWGSDDINPESSDDDALVWTLTFILFLIMMQSLVHPVQFFQSPQKDNEFDIGEGEEKTFVSPPHASNTWTCVVEATIVPLKTIVSLGEASVRQKKLRPEGAIIFEGENTEDYEAPLRYRRRLSNHLFGKS